MLTVTLRVYSSHSELLKTHIQSHFTLPPLLCSHPFINFNIYYHHIPLVACKALSSPSPMSSPPPSPHAVLEPHWPWQIWLPTQGICMCSFLSLKCPSFLPSSCLSVLSSAQMLLLSGNSGLGHRYAAHIVPLLLPCLCSTYSWQCKIVWCWMSNVHNSARP